MIVPGGGLSLDNARWVAARSNFLVYVNVLARPFRGKMLAMLMDAYDAGELKFFNTHAGLAEKRTFKRFIAPLRRIKWVFYCEAPFAGPEQVLRYLSRYAHRAPSRTAVSLPPPTMRSAAGGIVLAFCPSSRSAPASNPHSTRC